MKQLWFAILCIATTLVASAQNCSFELKGQVTDFHDSTPLYSALVQVAGTRVEAYTDFDGNFTITGLCNGDIELQISHPECETIIKPVTISGNTTITITLEHHLEELSEIVVSGNKKNETNSGTEGHINANTIQQYSNSNLATALKEVTGVSSLSTGNAIAKPVINGMHSSRVLVINNGVRLQDQEWGVEHAPNLDINTADHITVVKGAAALQYGGDAIGGTIIIDGSSPFVKDSLYGKTILSGSSNGRGGSLTSSLIKSYNTGWYVKGQGTFKYFGDYEAPDYVLSNTGSREKDFSAGFGLRKLEHGFNFYYSYYNAQIGILRASHIGSAGDLVNALESDKPLYIRDFSYNINAPYQRVIHHLAKADYYKRFSGLGKLDVQYAFQNNRRREYDTRVGDDKGKPSMDMVLQTHSIASTLHLDAFSGYKFSIGIAGNYQKNTPNPDTGIRRLIPDYTEISGAIFVTGEHQITDKTIIDAGVRYDYKNLDAKKFYQKSRWTERGYNEDFSDIIIGDYDSQSQWLTNPVYNFHTLSATLGIKSVLGKYTLAANASLASRAPNAAELFSDGLHHSAAVIELGDLRLQQEISHKLTTELRKHSGAFTFSLNPYVNYINNFIVLQPTGIETTTRGTFPVWEYMQNNTLFLGVDTDASYTFTDNWTYNTGLAYVYAQNTETNTPIINIPATKWSNTVSYTVPEWHNLYFGLKSETVFTQTRYPNNDFTAEVVTNEGTISKEVHISKPPKGYELLHFDSRITLNSFKNSEMTLGVSVQNILNTSYRDYLNRQRFYADDLGRNFNLSIILTY